MPQTMTVVSRHLFVTRAICHASIKDISVYSPWYNNIIQQYVVENCKRPTNNEKSHQLNFLGIRHLPTFVHLHENIDHILTINAKAAERTVLRPIGALYNERFNSHDYIARVTKNDERHQCLTFAVFIQRHSIIYLRRHFVRNIIRRRIVRKLRMSQTFHWLLNVCGICDRLARFFECVHVEARNIH